jgi:DNA polymerase (family 10)
MGEQEKSNAEVSAALRELALYLEMEHVSFKPRAYEKAAYTIMALDRPIWELHRKGGEAALAALPAIGKGIARRIAELLQTGQIADLEALRTRTPIDLPRLTALEGIGPRKAEALWRQLGVRSLEELKHAAESGQIREVPGFGERSEQKILQAIEFYQMSAGRLPLGEVLEVAKEVEAAMEALPKVSHAIVAGSIRRHRDTIGDLDLLVLSRSPGEVSTAFATLPQVQAVHAQGPTKTLVRLRRGIDADLRVLAPEHFGAALLYFTGSKAHNIALRKIAMAQGLKLNEYGLFHDQLRIAGRSEEEIYQALGLSWIPPELREDSGEIQLAQQGQLPRVVESDQVRGDLQVHTDWTDGSASIATMAEAARALGREYIVITDHTRDLAMTGGLDEEGLLEQAREIRKLDRELREIRVLAGAEVNIRSDGTLDIDDEVLAELDLVGAAVHSHFRQSRAEMTARLLRVIESPHVDVLFHPSCRKLGHRAPIDFDFEAILEACLRTGTVLEIDAQPQRMDLPDPLIRLAVDAGVLLALDSDAHSVEELRYLDTYGVGLARRGWATSSNIINTRPVEEMLAMLKGGHPRGKAKPHPRVGSDPAARR